jgi:hypothetical protein
VWSASTIALPQLNHKKSPALEIIVWKASFHYHSAVQELADSLILVPTMCHAIMALSAFQRRWDQKALMLHIAVQRNAVYKSPNTTQTQLTSIQTTFMKINLPSACDLLYTPPHVSS